MAGRARSRRTRRRKDIRQLELLARRRRRVPSCADAPASPSTRRDSTTPSAPSRRARGESGPLLPQRLKPLRFGRLHSFRGRGLRGLPLPGLRRHGGGGGGDRRRWWWRQRRGRSAALFQLCKRRRAAEIFEIAAAKGEGGGNAPVSPAYKEGRGGHFGLPNKQPPTISPTTPRLTRAVTGGAVDTELDSA